ncbi:MAG: lysozyme inhibitor LprI family protein [Burkholderiales bacterium]
MKRVLCALALAACSTPGLGQYAGPGVETCRAYAERELRKENKAIQSVVFEKDRDLQIDRYTRNLGSQFVSSLLYGNGAIVYGGRAPAIEMAFLCLLADDKRAVFFHWSPRRDAPALAQCRRGGTSAGECLDTLLQIAEQELTELYARHYVEAREADAKAGNEAALTAFRKSGDAWRAYRDVECARRPAGDERKACTLELTRRRALDLR